MDLTKVLSKIAVITLNVLLLSACGEDQPKEVKEIVRPVKTTVLGATSLESVKTFPGKVEASQVADLAFQVHGRLIEFPVREGQLIEKKQLIARLDPKDYQVVVDEMQAKRNLAKVELERAEILLSQKVTSQSRVDQRQASVDITDANLSAAENDLEYTYLRAPFVGLVARKYVENFQNVKAKEIIIRLQDISNIDISIDVPEIVVVRLEKGKTKTLLVEFEAAPGKKFEAQYKEHSSEADPATQTYNVTLTMLAPKDFTILPGMTVTVFAHVKRATDDAKEIHLIPSGAVFVGEKGKKFVWVVNPETSRVEKRAVQTSVLSGKTIQVDEGLNEGDQIITAGVHFIRENIKVSTMKTTEE